MAKKKNKIDKIDVGYWLAIICIFMLLTGLSIRGCKLGTNPDDYENICIEGHVYHTVNFGQKMALAIKLDDEGRPVKCE